VKELSLLAPKIGVILLALSMFVYFFSGVMSANNHEKSKEQIKLIQFIKKIGHSLAAIGLLVCILGIYFLVIFLGIMLTSVIVFTIRKALKTISNIVRYLLRK